MERKSSLRKIRAMFIIDFILGAMGGTENQVIKLITNLDRKKYEVYLVCLRETDWIRGNGTLLNCNIKTLKYNIFNHADPRNFVVFTQLVKFISRVAPDIVICFFKVSYVLGVLAARAGGVRNIISTRRDYGLWLNRWFIYPLRFANRFVRCIVTNSKNVANLTSREEKFDRSKIHVIYNGIDLDRLEKKGSDGQPLQAGLGIRGTDKVVGIVAGLRPMKRHSTFLRAAKKILDSRGDIHFVIVGDGPLKRELKNLTRDFGIGRSVHFVGWQQDVVPYLQMFDVGVNCSANEGLSNTIMEYMAYGVPCIVARAGGNEELIENGVNGYTFELDDDNELAQLIIALLDDKMKQKEFALKSREKILNELTLNRMIMEYDEYFTQILNAT